MFRFITILAFIITPLISNAAKKDSVIATVDGSKILKSELDEAYRQRMLFVSDKPATKDDVLKELINRRLGISRAKKNKLDKDPIVQSKMEDIMYHAQVSKDLEPKLKKISVTDDDVKGFYKEHPEYRTAHILFRVRAQPDDVEIEEALKKSIEVYNTLKKKPAKFAELANKFSQSSTAPNGGDMGFQPAIRLAPEYFKAIKGKPNEYISPPVRTQFGYHIIKILAVKDFKSVNMPLYKKIVYDKKRDSVLAKYFDDLRKGASIKIEKSKLK
ncbi:MAG: peptidylprolyl isomerase [Bacteriovoracaceae bacterium]|nr:peptidylprolyl isomerase [Bacteriovoracaceae bacterium]